MVLKRKQSSQTMKVWS